MDTTADWRELKTKDVPKLNKIYLVFYHFAINFTTVIRAHSHLATTTQIFDVVTMSSEMGCIVINVTVSTWRHKKTHHCHQVQKGPYRPQTKFAKVMFLHLPVTLLTGEGGVSQHAMGQTPPPQEETRKTPSEQCMLGDTGNKRECILVFLLFFFWWQSSSTFFRLAMGFKTACFISWLSTKGPAVGTSTQPLVIN